MCTTQKGSETQLVSVQTDKQLISLFFFFFNSELKMSFKSAPSCAVPSGPATMDLCLMDKLKEKSSESIREFRSPLSILLSVPAQGDDDIAIKGCKSVQSSSFLRLSLCCCKFGREYVVYFRAIYFFNC